MTMKLLIAGSRGYNDYDAFRMKVDKCLREHDKSKIEIIEGGAKGVDRLARRYAIENEMVYRTFEADWEQHGKSAGMIRNKQMANVATYAIIFWDGESNGTRNMIENCEHQNIPYRLIKVKVDECKREDL